MPYKDKAKQNKYHRELYARSPERRQQQKVRIKAARQKFKQYLISLKTNKPCTDCNVIYPYYVMDWDHIKGQKLFNVSKSAAWRIGIKTILAEINKCELVCANCHRIRTYDRIKNDWD